MDGSGEAEYVTAPATATETSTTPSSPYLSARTESMVVTTDSERGIVTSIEDQIESSKSHWSELADYSDFIEEEVVADNLEVFKSLQLNPTWGPFFQTFGYDTEHYLSFGSLEVGSKFAEGAEAELFHARVTWKWAERNEMDLKEGYEWVLKVFKKGTSLRRLQSQWPLGLFQQFSEGGERVKLDIPQPTRHWCVIFVGTLLEDGRFAFLMLREEEDLRHLIDRKMLTHGRKQGPFSEDEAEAIMYSVACGMDWLHRRNIVHRDLKASNVLCTKYKEGGLFNCFVADFECSIGVVGTGFWRAPEILQACKEKNISQRPELFTKSADVYSYGMTCYEILTRKVPFGGHPTYDYDLVLNGQQLELPEYVDDWIHGLLNRCWHPNPAARPSFGNILNVIITNSIGIYVEIGEFRKIEKLFIQ